MALISLPPINVADWKKLMDYEKDLLTARPLIAVDHDFGSSAVNCHTHSVIAPINVNQRWSENNLLKMIASRLGWDAGEMMPFRRIVPVKVTNDMVAIFIVTNNNALIIEDETNLFPSDALITQLRLLIEAL
jgi:hypothetical protein